MVTKIYFIRHAEAVGNVDGVYHGRTDGSLTENGFRQLDCLAKRFETTDFDVIYSSPITRARLTAEAADRTKKLPIQFLDGLVELDGGEWEGMTWDEIHLRFPKEHEMWDTRLDLFKAPGGESVAEVQERMKSTVDKIIDDNKGKTIVVVTHGCALRTYICYARGLSLAGINEDKWAMNTSVSLVEYDDDKKPKLIFRGDVAHLENDGIDVKRF